MQAHHRESAMTDIATKICLILRGYVFDPVIEIRPNTTLCALRIDFMDLPMISLDIEDAFGVQIPYDDDAEALPTVQSLVSRVESLLDAKARQPRIQCVKSTWLSTAAADRRR